MELRISRRHQREMIARGALAGVTALSSAQATRVGSSSVTTLRATDGVNLGTFFVGGYPYGVAFDGANVWVANNGGNDVTRLRASDGANLGRTVK